MTNLLAYLITFDHLVNLLITLLLNEYSFG